MHIVIDALKLNQLADFKHFNDPRKIRWNDNEFGNYGKINWAYSCGTIVYANGDKYCDLYAWDHEEGIMIEAVTGLENSPYDCMFFTSIESALLGEGLVKGGISEYATKLIPRVAVKLFEYKGQNSEPF